ncbi:hypothetical protein GCM10029992_55110 [Glycomyces albus]
MVRLALAQREFGVGGDQALAVEVDAEIGEAPRLGRGEDQRDPVDRRPGQARGLGDVEPVDQVVRERPGLAAPGGRHGWRMLAR